MKKVWLFPGDLGGFTSTKGTVLPVEGSKEIHLSKRMWNTICAQRTRWGLLNTKFLESHKIWEIAMFDKDTC